MKIGAFLGFHGNMDIEQAFRKFVDMELECCQLGVWDDALYTKENAAAIRAAADRTGIEITALWAGWTGPMEWNAQYGPATLGIVPPAWRAQRYFELEAGSRFATLLGVTDMITHVGFLPENPGDPDFVGTVGTLRKLCRDMQARGQYFLFETGQETPVTMLRAIEEIGTDNVGINLDTANLITYGKANTLDALDVFGRYVRSLHCKDGTYPPNDTEVPLGQGKADIARVIKKLHAMGYNGSLVIEREISGDQQIRDIAAARDLLRSIVAQL